jgi:very-short-patch-repair endonuclease
MAPELPIALLARRQNGAIRREQLIALGLTAAEIRTRVARGQLHRIHRGVYAVADPSLLPLVRHSAALLSVGARGVISHRTAAAIWTLAATAAALIDVTVLGASARRREGIEIHRALTLDPREITTRHNLRVTTPARTLIDFAAGAPTPELEHALAEAYANRLINDNKLAAALKRAPTNHPGAARLNTLLRAQSGRALTRSERERRMLALLDRAQLPRPVVNQYLHGFLVDFYWPAHSLAVEFDGYNTHATRAKFDSDRKRDQILLAHGVRTMRVTDRQLLGEPIAVATRIAQAMTA